jgi:hypothetical protein
MRKDKCLLYVHGYSQFERDKLIKKAKDFASKHRIGILDIVEDTEHLQTEFIKPTHLMPYIAEASTDGRKPIPILTLTEDARERYNNILRMCVALDQLGAGGFNPYRNDEDHTTVIDFFREL